jgi:pyridoxamine 5'-phosphate oxidase family protein
LRDFAGAGAEAFTLAWGGVVYYSVGRQRVALTGAVRAAPQENLHDRRVYMSVFTQAEIEYLKSRRIGRLATVSEACEPHVVPARFLYNAELDTIDIGGHDMGKSKKYRDAARSGRAAFVVDDMPQPGEVRGIEVRGRAEAVTTGGEQIISDFDPEFIRLVPTHIAVWGIETDGFHPVSRTVGK